MKDEEWDESRGEGLYEDLHFPADDTSLFSDFSTPIARLQGDIVWRRPQEICQSPALFPDNMNQGHAKQGLLGDCWFLCACTVLLKNKHLLDRVLSPDQPQWGASGYRGCFRFRLWQQGCWAEVTVDDRLPCIGATLCFSRCHAPNAFWVALLEKAYAKLHGSYERLWAGQVSEALVDLTGGLAECRSLGSAECRSLGSAECRSLGSAECRGLGSAECRSLGSAESRGLGSSREPEESGTRQDSDRGRRRRLNLNQLQAVRDVCALSCSTHSTPAAAGGPSSGGELGQHHALSVMEWVDVRRTSGGSVKLLRIRNPWGRRCCGGAWTERGEGWSSVDPVCATSLQGRAQEGDFWVDEAEFVSRFDDVTVGYPINQEGHLQSIYTGNVLTHSTQLVGRWMKGHSAGGCRNSSSYGSNPKFWLKVCERGEVLVSLLQQRRCRNTATHYAQRPPEGTNTNTKHQHYHQAIALHMWKVEKKRLNLGKTLSNPPCASTHCHAYEREVVLHAHLEPGYHLLIPSTFLPGAEASFLIRAFSLSPLSLSALKAPGPSLPLATDGEWETSVFCGVWEAGTTGGGSRNFLSHRRNPRFPFAVREDPAKAAGVNNVRVNLHQNRADTDLHPIGFHIYKVPEEGVPEPTLPRDEEPVASCVPHCYMQDVSLACRLPAGHYVVVPSTYQPDCPASFTLTVAHTIHRRVVKSQERLGRSIQEVSHISVMRS